MTGNSAGKPLDGVRIVDLSTVLMGPLCTQILADSGAEVIKVEPIIGDTTRHIGPSVTPGMGPLFMNLNRGKKTVSLDLSDARCRDALDRLIAGADVLIHNLRPKVAQRRGLDFERMKAINPALVYCNLYGYGQNGPYKDRPAYDDLIQGACGLPALFARAGASKPRFVPVNVADRIVGLYAAIAIPIGLHAARRSGTAQKVELPMFEVLASLVLGDHLYGATAVGQGSALGYPRLLSPDRRPFATRDGYICVAVYNDNHWRRFLPAIGREDILDDPRFASLNSRVEHIDTVSAFLSGILIEEPTAHWMEFFDRLDIPVSPMNTIESLLADPQTLASGLVVERDHPTEGRTRAVANPMVWNDASLSIGEAPKLGQHTREILNGAGLSDGEIDAMARDGIIVAAEA
ncbi:CaiB/BaiF CoA transferase family protein [Pseudooceanicola pacificus]|nr:CoA transferase [Pseudooceanicola pacificus]